MNSSRKSKGSPLQITCRWVRDLPVTAQLKGNAVLVALKVGRQIVERAEFAVCEWPAGLFEQTKLTRERLAVMDQPPEFICQRTRIADAVRYAVARVIGGG